MGSFFGKAQQWVANTSVMKTISGYLHENNIVISDSTMQVLKIAVVTLIILLLVLLILLLVLPKKKKIVRKRRVYGPVDSFSGPEEIVGKSFAKVDAPSSEEVAAEAATKGDADKKIKTISPKYTSVLILILSVILLLGVYVYTGSDSYCSKSCHEDIHSTVAGSKSRHARCVDCHEGNQFTAAVPNVVSRVSMWKAAIFNQDEEISFANLSVQVGSDRCISCHREVLTETVKTAGNIAVSHKEFLDEGQICLDCHQQVGHTKTRSYTGKMLACSTCHDDKIASSACATCHTEGSPLDTSASLEEIENGDIQFPVTRIAKQNCGGCHEQEKACDPCHWGYRMPHSEEFIDGGHARQAAFGGKKVCLNCHKLESCSVSGCHGSFSSHNTESWKTGHQSGTNAQCGGCHNAKNRKQPFCSVCHPGRTK